MKNLQRTLFSALALSFGIFTNTFAASNVAEFDGDDDHINAGDINAMDGISTFTIEAWAKWNSLDNLSTIFSKRANHIDKIQVGLDFDMSGQKMI